MAILAPHRAVLRRARGLLARSTVMCALAVPCPNAERSGAAPAVADGYRRAPTGAQSHQPLKKPSTPCRSLIHPQRSSSSTRSTNTPPPYAAETTPCANYGTH